MSRLETLGRRLVWALGPDPADPSRTALAAVVEVLRALYRKCPAMGKTHWRRGRKKRARRGRTCGQG